MSTRGRGAAPKRGAGPNLAQSGVREDKRNANSRNQNNQDKSTTRGRGRGRGGRGSGRGGSGGGFRDKPALIQSEGIFSEGLSAIERPKKEREKLPGFSGGTRVRDDVKPMENGDLGKSSVPGWDEMWESDGEEDTAELKELFHDSFISDLKKGDRMPMVLPEKDEGQFSKVLHSSVKKEFFSDSEDEKMEVDNDTTDKHNIDGKETSTKEMEKPTIKFSKKAAKCITQLEGSRDMVFLQLPSVVNMLVQPPKDYDKVQPSEKDIIPEQSDSTDFLPNLPAGKKIGKLQITRSGRTLLKIGDYTMDVTQSGSSGHQENMVLVETSASSESANEDFGFGMQDMKSLGRNAVYHIGTIKHHLTASLDWEGVRDSRNMQPAVPAMEEVELGARETNSLRKELENLKKEAEMWGEDAEKWAAPLNQKS